MAIYCDKYRGILSGIDGNDRKLIRLRCKMWSCRYCAEINRNIWRARIIAHINEIGGNWSWFTLTAHRQKRGSKLSLQNLRDATDKLFKRIRRKFGKVHYCRVFEKHKDGSYHLHCIISVHFDDIKTRHQKDGKKVKYSAWLKKTATELSLGYYTHADNFEGEHAGYIAGYVAKYLTKIDNEFRQELGRVRHIQTSQNWYNKKPDNPTPHIHWDWKNGYHWTDYLWDTEANGLVLVIDITNDDYLITLDDFEDDIQYPPKNGL